MNVHERVRQHRAEGIPLHVRLYDTAAGEARFWLYYGYKPPIGHGLTEEQAEVAIRAAVRVHRTLTEVAA